jgi:transcriptional regulator with XRE-family HTH domain
MTAIQGRDPGAPIALDLARRVARNVRAEAARNGDRQVELAQVLDLAQQAVSARMSGRTPLTLRDLERLARHWNMSVLDLIAGRPSGDPPPVDGSATQSFSGWRTRRKIKNFTSTARRQDQAAA